MGLYQLLYMDKIPDAAAVNEAVALAKKYCKQVTNAPALVNGVLRSGVRRLDSLEQPVTLADKYSHPEGLIQLFRGYLGEEKLETMLRANNEAPETVIQVNTLKTDAAALQLRLEQEGATVKPHSWMENCLVLSAFGSMEKLPAFRDGEFYVQDAAAKLSVLCAGIGAGAAVLDCCAAPGGKTFAAVVQGAGSVISCDVHEHKIGLIRSGAQRLGFSNVEAMQRDATAVCPQWEGKMDVVIADVPCSGYGIIRKKPDIRYKDPATMRDLPQLQLQILKNQARYVKPGGVLLYSTCTLVWEENEGNVKRFLAENDDFYLEKLTLPAVFPANTTGMLRLVPGEYDTDGFFIARLRRKA